MTLNRLVVSFLGMVLISAAMPLEASTVTERVSGYFDLDSSVDELRYSFEAGSVQKDEPGLATIEILLGGADGSSRVTRTYHMSESHMSVHNRQKGEIAILESGLTGSSEKTISYYRYNETVRDWLLVTRLVESRNYHFVNSVYEIKYYSGTKGLDGTVIEDGLAEVEPPSARALRMRRSLSALHEEMAQLYRNKQLKSTTKPFCDIETLVEWVHNVPVSIETVEIYNNIGFFMSQIENGDRCAVYVLQQVIKNVPDRTPAYLNLGDVLDSLSMPAEAVSAYKAYAERMRKSGKERSIPQRVREKLQ